MELNEFSQLMKRAKDVKSIAEFEDIWTQLFTKLVGKDNVGFMKRLVAEQQLVATDIFTGPQEAAMVTIMSARHFAAQGAGINGLVLACYADLCNLVVERTISSEDAAELSTLWFHEYHTIPQLQGMAAQGITKEQLLQMQKDKNAEQKAEYQAIKAANQAENGGKPLAYTNSFGSKEKN